MNQDPQFPDVPITDRYTAETLQGCIQVSEKTSVTLGDLWDPVAKKFVTPPVPAPLPDPDPNPDLPPTPTTGKRIQQLESKLTAAIESNNMLEGCVVDMAGVVYA